MAGSVGPLSILPDGSFALFVRPETYVNVRTITTSENFQVPSGAKYVVFGATGNFCVRYNTTTTGGTAAAFTDTTDGSGCEINPTVRYLYDTVRAISVKVETTNDAVSLTFFK